MKKIRVGVLGLFQHGKSTIINCFLNNKISKTGGDSESLTIFNTIFTFGEKEYVKFSNYDKIFSFEEFSNMDLSQYEKSWGDAIVFCNAPSLQNFDLVDTPGFNANKEDTKTANDALEKIDFAFLIIANKGTINDVEKKIINSLGDKDIPFMVVMNCRSTEGDTWNPASKFNNEKVKSVETYLQGLGPIFIKDSKGNCVWPVNLAWYWYGSDGYKKDEVSKQEDLLYEIEYYSKKHGGLSQLDFERMSNFCQLQLLLKDARHPLCIKIKGLVYLFSAIRNR